LSNNLKTNANKFQFLLAPDICDQWDRAPGATPEAISTLVASLSLKLPIDYLDFLQFSNGADGPLPVQPLWCSLFKAEELVVCNQDYEIAKYLPGYLAIGSSGGGEVILFDTRTWRVCTVPVLFAEEHIWEIAPNFMQLAEMLGRS